MVTKDLGEEVGQDEAAGFIQEVKEEVIREKVDDPDDLMALIKRIAAEHNIELSDAQIQQIMELMQKISRLDLNLDSINKQLENIMLTWMISKGCRGQSGSIQKYWIV